MRGLVVSAVMLAMGLAGCGGSGPAAQPSVATRASELPAVDPMSQLGRDDTILHQADWRQFEFYAADRRPELEQALAALHNSEELYVRTVPASTTIAGRAALRELDKVLGTRSAGAPFLGQGKGKVSGQLFNGFTVRLDGLLLYGLHDYDGINVLGAVVQDREKGRATLAQAFARLNKAHGLLAVDWRTRTLFTGVNEDGSLDGWRP